MKKKLTFLGLMLALVACQEEKSSPAVPTPRPTPTPTPAPAEEPAASPTPTPTPQPTVTPRLAAEGVYFLLERVSMMTDSGIVAFDAGKQVTLVSAEGETVVVTDGRSEMSVPKDKLTRDLDVAEALQAQVEQSKTQTKETIQQSAQARRTQEEERRREIKASQEASLKAAKISRLEAAIAAADREIKALQKAYQKSISAYRQTPDGKWYRKSDTGAGSRPDSIENRARKERISKLQADIKTWKAQIKELQ